MTPLETSRALEKLLTVKPGETVQKRDEMGRFTGPGYKSLAREIGKSHIFVLEHLRLLDEEKKMALLEPQEGPY